MLTVQPLTKRKSVNNPDFLSRYLRTKEKAGEMLVED